MYCLGKAVGAALNFWTDKQASSQNRWSLVNYWVMKFPLSLCPACAGMLVWPELRGQREAFVGMKSAAGLRGEDGMKMSRHRGPKASGGAILRKSHSGGDLDGARLLSHKRVLCESHAGGDWHYAKMFLHDAGMYESRGGWDSCGASLLQSHDGWDSHIAKKLLHSARMSESHGRWDLHSVVLFSYRGVLSGSPRGWDSDFFVPEEDGAVLCESHGAWDSDFFGQGGGHESLFGAGDRQSRPWVLWFVPPVTKHSP